MSRATQNAFIPTGYSAVKTKIWIRNNFQSSNTILLYYLAHKKRGTLINKCISFEILIKISTMMAQYLVWPYPSTITAAILGMDL